MVMREATSGAVSGCVVRVVESLVTLETLAERQRLEEVADDLADVCVWRAQEWAHSA